MKPARVFVLTFLAMIAFATNSLLCRAALKQTTIDAATFTFDRIFSGAVALWIIILLATRTSVKGTSDSSLVTRDWALRNGTWLSALALCIYAAAFSFAYITLPAGTGALLLFGAVQATMIFWAFARVSGSIRFKRSDWSPHWPALFFSCFPGFPRRLQSVRS